MRALTFALSLALTGASAAAASLSDEADINRGLLAVGIADEVRKKCDSIEPRLIRAYSFLNDLKAQARAKGYSDDEIEAYVTSDAEKKRMRALGEAYLQKNGVDLKDASSYCTFGEEEIAKGSQIGVLLRAR
ncbi:DUF5333 domain-containing protein [Litorisediminicola beolgyonensis]|uniref:DUF5333 domain-containing protein n=1 Tax=Litorisediminicola beolgyonensis TaxID=1173614 RepID=A0ABW3ZL06_9RHOB